MQVHARSNEYEKNLLRAVPKNLRETSAPTHTMRTCAAPRRLRAPSAAMPAAATAPDPAASAAAAALVAAPDASAASFEGS
jgi:hypothetical protein